MIKLIALDLDGTLLNSAEEITQETKDAIAQAQAQGVRVVLATGRSVQEAMDFGSRAGCDNLAVYCILKCGIIILHFIKDALHTHTKNIWIIWTEDVR